MLPALLQAGRHCCQNINIITAEHQHHCSRLLTFLLQNANIFAAGSQHQYVCAGLGWAQNEYAQLKYYEGLQIDVFSVPGPLPSKTLLDLSLTSHLL